MGGRVYGIVNEGDDALSAHCDTVFELPLIDERLAPMIFTIPVQLFAYHVAMAKFELAERSLDQA